MHGSEQKDGRHSNPEVLPPRASLWPRVLVSLAIVGLMVGLMIGRLTETVPSSLDRIELHPDQLVLWFDGEPEVQADTFEGAFAVRLQAHGAEASGELLVGGHPAKWRVRQAGQQQLLLSVVAARHLQGSWVVEKADGRWRLSISLREQ